MGTQVDFATVLRQIWARKVTPVLDTIYPFTEYPAALARLLSGTGFGKVLLRVA